MSKVHLVRQLDADPATVWDFVTQTHNLVAWWGPEGMTLPDFALDFTQAGADWHSVMMNADGGRYTVSGKVLAVDPGKSVELSWAWHDDSGKRGHESTVRFVVAKGSNGGTQFELIHTGLADDESAANHDIGWTSSLRKLERMS